MDIEVKNFVPLAQTAIWAGVVVWVLWNFKTQVQGLIESLKNRVDLGSEVVVKAGEVTIKPPKLKILKQLKKVSPEQHEITLNNPENISETGTSDIVTPENPEEWSLFRDGIYRKQRGLFLSHILYHSSEPGQVYDIYISLFRHKDGGFEDIEKAEFFLGRHWRNKAILGTNLGEIIGMRTSAYSPFLCVCKVTFNDGETVMIDRYIDFEMGSFVPKTATT